MTEILAPAGGREQLEAAVRAGADAVYLGYGAFNARRHAQNFTLEELKDAVAYAHARGVKVHATLNTLVTEAELPDAEKDIRALAEAGVDAVIVQDLGIARMVKECVPTLALHASTQLTVHNAAGVRVLEQLGFSRVVLARELSLEEIRTICASTKLEVEVFIHGALCMCVSGGCYLSSVLGQRSGNRGLCAQPCRLDFTVHGREYALSLKDMSHIAYLRDLEAAGVCSFKIEGRMKRPEYVAAAVTACRQARDGQAPDLTLLRNVFSRSGFTDGYLLNKRNLTMFGYRQKEDVLAAAPALKEAARLYQNERASVALTGEFTLLPDAPAVLTASDGKNVVTVTGPVPEKAEKRSTTEEDIRKQLQKTGGTVFYWDALTVRAEDGLTFPLSALNALRRDALEQLTARRQTVVPHDFHAFFYPAGHPAENRDPRLWVRVQNVRQAEGLTNVRLILPVQAVTPGLIAQYPDLIGEIPSLVFPGDEGRLAKTLADLREKGLRFALCDNIGALALAREAGLAPIGGWGLNITNSVAADTWISLGLTALTASFENSFRNVRDWKITVPTGLIGYGTLPLMRMRACPAQTKNGCAGCTGVNTMTDRMNVSFPLLCCDKRFTMMLNSVPLYVGDKADDSADFWLLYFYLESPAQVKNAVSRFASHRDADFPRTGGLYFKTLR